MDNDGDSTPNDQKMVDHFIKEKSKILVSSTPDKVADELKNTSGQPSGIDETSVRSCGIPKFRGADSADRSTWAAKISSTTDGSTACEQAKDATVEEVLHALSTAAAQVYPSVWGINEGENLDKIVHEQIIKDCGSAVYGNYKDPNSDACTGK